MGGVDEGKIQSKLSGIQSRSAGLWPTKEMIYKSFIALHLHFHIMMISIILLWCFPKMEPPPPLLTRTHRRVEKREYANSCRHFHLSLGGGGGNNKKCDFSTPSTSSFQLCQKDSHKWEHPHPTLVDCPAMSFVFFCWQQVTCAANSRNKYEKHKSVELGDQLHPNQPPPPSMYPR